MALLWEKSHDALRLCVEEGVRFVPFPSPPHLFEEMPAVQPKPDIICRQVIGVNSIDKAGFRTIIEDYLNLSKPDYVKRSIDEERALDQYIYDSIDLLIDKFLIARISDWFRLGLDSEVPDTDRWWWAIALFIGVSIRRPNAILNDGFHLLESIALGTPPGQWQTKPQKGPHLVDWNGIQDSENMVEIHIDGAIAAAWILDTLNDEKTLMQRWWPEIINRPHLYIPLRMNERLNLSLENTDYLDIHLDCISHLVIQDLDLTQTLIENLLEKVDSKNLAKMVSISERISYHSIEISLKLIDAGFSDDGDASVIAQSALSALATHDEQAFLSRVELAAYHTNIRSRRRFVQSGLRILMQIDPVDSRAILLNSLIEDDEISRQRLRRFAIEMCEKNPNSKEKLVTALNKHAMDADWLL